MNKKMKKKLGLIISALILFVVAFCCPANWIILKNSLFVVSYLLVGFEILKKAARNIVVVMCLMRIS